ncbi:MAG: ABC transporter substrate-binding protein [Coriobacteriales bacterium]|jgi:peptide/nickel transport system substrate-binding protein|nr:ABC transporter substrate-binding protein [Coriobacteriales bacterium]
MEGSTDGHGTDTAQAPISRRAFARIAGAGALAALAGPVLSACTAAPEETPDADTTGADPNAGGVIDDGAVATGAQVTVAIGTGNEPAAGFDPFFNWGAGEHSHEPLIQSTLVTTTVDMGFQNDLATDYKVSDDGLLWTFTIRDDVRFTDGEALTAADVAYTLNGIKASRGSETDLSMIREAAATDGTTVELRLERPYNALLYTLANVGIVPGHAHGTDYGEKPIGSGRYRLEQWDRGQQAVFVANPDYYGERPLMERVVVVFMEEDASMAAVQSRQVDMAATSAVFSSQVVDGYDILSCKSVDSRGISLPTLPFGSTKTEGDAELPAGDAVTSDLAIRRALSYAVDRDLMVQNVLNGYGTVAFSVSDGMPWSSPDMKVVTSVDEAIRIMEEGGWTFNEDGIAEKDGVRAGFELCYPSNDGIRQALANEFANQVRAAGIVVSVSGLSWDDLYPRAYSTPIVWGWGSNSPAELYSLFHSSGSGNFPCYSNASVDRYLDSALEAETVEESFSLWQKAQWDGTEGIAPQGAATWVWLANIDHLYLKRTGLVVAQQKLHPHGHGWAVLNNVDRWTWEQGQGIREQG